MSMWNSIVSLAKTKESVNNYGDIVFSEEKQDVYCNIVSVSQKEFYQAQSLGFQPELKIEIMAIDYNEQNLVYLNSKRYRVLRTYLRKDEIMELTLTSVNNRGEQNGSTE